MTSSRSYKMLFAGWQESSLEADWLSLNMYTGTAEENVMLCWLN